MDKLIPNSSKDNTPQDQLNGLAKSKKIPFPDPKIKAAGFSEKTESLTFNNKKVEEIESQIIWFILRHPSQAKKAVEEIEENKLYFQTNRPVQIFTAIKKLYYQKTVIDVSTVGKQMEKDGTIEFIGGAVYLGELIAKYKDSNIISSAQIPSCFQQIKEIIQKEKSPIEFLENYKPKLTEWLIPNFFEKQGLAIVAGKPGVGKTTFAIRLAVINANREEFYRNSTNEEEWPKGDGRKGLYICAERKPEDAADILLACGGELKKHVDIVKTIDGKVPNLSNPEHLNYILELIITGDYSSVIIDPIVEIALSEQNDNAKVREKLIEVRDRLKHKDTLILGLMHLKKDSRGTDVGGAIRGASEWANVPHAVCVIKKDKDGDHSILQKYKINKSKTGNKGGFKYLIEDITLPPPYNHITKGGIKGPFEYIDKDARDINKQCESDLEQKGETNFEKVKKVIARLEAEKKPMTTTLVKDLAKAEGVSGYYLDRVLNWSDFGYKTEDTGFGGKRRVVLTKLT